MNSDVFPSSITSEHISKIRECLLEEYRQFPSNLKRDGIAEMNIGSGEETRYILELLQNADDAQYPGDNSLQASLEGKLTFVLTASSLYCANTGYPISVDGLKALCDSFLSTKTRSKPIIGFKGIGYKSILGITERPSIYWHNGCVAFSKNDAWRVFVEIVPSITKEQVPILRYPGDLDLNEELNHDSILEGLWNNHTTVFKFPLRNGITAEDVWDRLREVTASTLLFTHHLTKVEVRTIDLPYDGILFNVTRLDSDEIEQTTIEVDGNKNSWLVIREIYPISEDQQQLFPRDTQDVKTVEVAAALELDEDNQTVKPYDAENSFPKLHVFFPTDEIVPFHILLHGSFRTNIDRRTVTYDHFNRFIVTKMASLITGKVIKTILERIADKSQLLDFLEQHSLDSWFQKSLSQEVISLIKTMPIISGDGKLGLVSPIETMFLPTCVEGKIFRKMFQGFEYTIDSEWKKMCSEGYENDPVRREVLTRLGATELSPVELPKIIESYDRLDEVWVGESYGLLDRTSKYMVINNDQRYIAFLSRSKASKLLLTSGKQFVSALLPREEGIIFAPPESDVSIITPPKIRLRLLEKKSIQTYLRETDQTFRQSFLHEKLEVKEYNTEDIISGAVIPEIREFWERRPALTHFDPKKMLNFLLDLLQKALDSDNQNFSLDRENRTLALQSLPLPVKHRDTYARAYQVYFPKDWSGTDDLEEIYGLNESYFLDLSIESFPEEKRSSVRRLLEALGVSSLPKIKEQFSPEQSDDWLHSNWEKGSGRFVRSPHAGLPNWEKYCRDIFLLLSENYEHIYSKSSTLALKSSYELDRFDIVAKDRQRTERLLGVIATNRAYFDQYLYCDLWYTISRVPDSKKIPSYFAWQLKNTKWIPTTFCGKQGQELPHEAYLATPSLKRLFRDSIPYVNLSKEMKRSENELFSLLRELGVRESIDQLEPSDWWKTAIILPIVYEGKLSEKTTEEEIRAIYRAMLDRQNLLESDDNEKTEFIKSGKLLATVDKTIGFHLVNDVWYTEVDRYERLFSLPIFTVKRQYNRGSAISNVFNLHWIEKEITSNEKIGPAVDSVTDLLGASLSEVAPFFLSRLSVEIAMSTQEQIISRLKRLSFLGVNGLTVEYTLKAGDKTYQETREEPLLMKAEGDGFTLIVNTNMLPVFSNELTIESALKIGAELASFLRLPSSLGYEFAELLRKNEVDRFKTLASAFDIREETIEHFRRTFNEDAGIIEITIDEEPKDSEQKKPIITPYQTLEQEDKQDQEEIRLWNIDDLQFGEVQTIDSVEVSKKGGHSQGHSVGPGHMTNEELKKAIEISGQNLVEKWLGRVAGYTNVKPVPKENKGWDVEATKDGIVYFFEVKSSGSSVNVIEITMPEWQKAQMKREKYYLVQVINLTYRNLETAKYPELLIIRNPYDVLAANPTRFRVKLSEFRRYNALEAKRVFTLNPQN